MFNLDHVVCNAAQSGGLKLKWRLKMKHIIRTTIFALSLMFMGSFALASSSVVAVSEKGAVQDIQPTQNDSFGRICLNFPFCTADQ